MNIFYDTSSLLVLQEQAFINHFYISDITLQEIESIKTSSRKDEEIKYKARKLIKLLDTNADKYSVIFTTDEMCNQFKDTKIATNDLLIASCANKLNKEVPIIFCTDDICLKVIAKKRFGLTVTNAQDYLKVKNEYKGYKQVCLSDDKMAYMYEHIDENIFDCAINEYVVINNIKGQTQDKRRWNGEKYIPLNYRHVPREIMDKVSPVNPIQELAFDLLQDKDIKIKVLTGGFGVGKDYLMTSHALHLLALGKFQKIVWVRNNIEVKNTKPIGYLPGTYDEKLISFAMPMADHIGSRIKLEELVSSGQIELEHLGLIRGRNFDNSLVICSECENMTKEHIQLLIGRVGKNSELWLNGDNQQIDDKIFESNNGLRRMIERLYGQKLFGHIELDQIERSEVARLSTMLN